MLNYAYDEDVYPRLPALTVELCHCALHADMNEAVDHLRRTVNQCWQLHQLVVIKATEHIVYLPAFRKIAPDTETEPGVPLTAAQGFDVLQSVVASTAALCPQTDFTEGQ